MNPKNDLATKIVTAVFLVVGGALLIAALCIGGVSVYRASNWPAVPAVVTDMDSSGRATLEYTLETGEHMIQKMPYSDSDFYIGGEMTIRYDPSNPERIATSFSSLAALVMGGVGLFFLLFCLLFAVLGSTKKGRARRLMKNGVLVYADINEVYINHTLRVNGRNPWQVRLFYYDAERGLDYTFKTINLWEDPQPAIDQKQLTTLPVYINPKNPKRYYVVVDELAR